MGADGTGKDVGVLTIQTAFRLTGRVVLSDDKPLPSGIRLILSRDQARDHLVADVVAAGSFAFTGLPDERFALGANVPSYRLSSQNASRNLDGLALEGRIDKDIIGLRVLVEPGNF